MEVLLENPNRSVLIVNIISIIPKSEIKLGRVLKKWNSVEEIKQFRLTHGVFIHPFANIDWPSNIHTEVIIFENDAETSFERYYEDLIYIKAINVFLDRFKERYTPDKQIKLLEIKEQLKMKYLLQ